MSMHYADILKGVKRKVLDEYFFFFCGSGGVSVSCFGVGVSVMFHFMFVHYTFSSVWVSEWPPFWKKLLARLAICSRILSFCNIYFPFWFLERDLPFDCYSSCLLLFYYF